MMKNKSGLFGLLLLLVIVLAACTPEIKTCSGHINTLTDSLMMVQIGEYEVKFDVKRAQYGQGAVMSGDSVNVDYIGDLRKKEARALIINLVPEPGTVVDAAVDTTKELITSPMSEEDARRLQEFVDNTKRK